MKYPFEKVSILELMRHPFDEETGDVHTRMSMRVLSLIFFPFYVVMQVIIPLYFFSTFYNDKEWSLVEKPCVRDPRSPSAVDPRKQV